MRESEYQFPTDPSTIQKLLLEKGDVFPQSPTRSNGLRDESPLSEKDSGRLRLTRLFKVGQRRRIGGRTVRGRITWVRGRHYRGEDRFWDERYTPRSVVLRQVRRADLDEAVDWVSFCSPSDSTLLEKPA